MTQCHSDPLSSRKGPFANQGAAARLHFIPARALAALRVLQRGERLARLASEAAAITPNEAPQLDLGKVGRNVSSAALAKSSALDLRARGPRELYTSASLSAAVS